MAIVIRVSSGDSVDCLDATFASPGLEAHADAFHWDIGPLSLPMWSLFHGFSME